MSTTPVADHALLSDRHSSALIDHQGSVEWLAFPRFDSPSVCGRLLGPEAGHWQVAPVAPATTSRRYVGHGLGSDVPHLLVRRLECTVGAVEVAVQYAPRPEYGLVVPLLSHVEGAVTARGGADWLVLSCPVPLDIEMAQASGRVSLRAGEALHMGLQWSTLETTPARAWTQPELADALECSVQAWESWSALHQAYDGPWTDLVHHSGRVLQGLSFQPSGAIVAAATTSLPEGVGGERNWDYRYSWV